MERVIDCPVCYDPDRCFEDTQDKFISYMCFNCGFMSSSLYSKDNKDILQPNQVICIEPFFYHDGGFPIWTVSNKYGLEDQILVTETGHEILSPDEYISRDIWIA